MSSLKVLFLSRNYPNNVMPTLGLWTEGLARHVGALCELRVVAPAPYCPPLPASVEYTRFRRIPLREKINGIEVWHPRFFVGPGYSLYDFEASTYYLGIARRVERLHRAFPFDLIHAHFTYPDGVAAARLGHRYQVPVLITEHSPWRPGMELHPRARRQALWAAERCTFHIPVSRYTQDTIAHFTGASAKFRIIPNGVDTSVFTPLSDGQQPIPNQILFVGVMRHVKGLDILINAMRRLVERSPQVRLVVVGGGFYKKYRQEEEELHGLVHELGLGDNIEFVGTKSPREVAQFMRESALLVMSSRSETFGSVLIEALACGTPVVATRCGGPEDIVNDEVGVLVPKEDPDALANGIERVLERRSCYDPARLRAYALENFGWERIARRTVELYQEAVEGFGEVKKP